MPPAADAGAAAAAPGQRTAWSYHESGDEGAFWWCAQIDLSTYAKHLDIPGVQDPAQSATDSQLWCAVYDRMVRDPFKLCRFCASPREEFADPFFVCGTCARHCHNACSTPCREIVNSAVWEAYAPYLRSCNVCNGQTAKSGFVQGGASEDQRGAWGALNRLKSVALPHATRAALTQIEERLPPIGDPRRQPGAAAAAFKEVHDLVRDHYCPNGCWRYWRIGPSKGGEGVFAVGRVPAFTRVGVMPGYPDALCGEQTTRGRPAPKYALADINAADYYNDPFPEYRGCPAWCVNEPGEGQQSNTAWLQESSELIEPGRMSVVTVRELQDGEEAMLCYGPKYPRDYPYAYDAYTFHPRTEAPTADGVYELWYYPAEDAEAQSRGCIRHDREANAFVEWRPPTAAAAAAGQRGEWAGAH